MILSVFSWKASSPTTCPPTIHWFPYCLHAWFIWLSERNSIPCSFLHSAWRTNIPKAKSSFVRCSKEDFTYAPPLCCYLLSSAGTDWQTATPPLHQIRVSMFLEFSSSFSDQGWLQYQRKLCPKILVTEGLQCVYGCANQKLITVSKSLL